MDPYMMITSHTMKAALQTSEEMSRSNVAENLVQWEFLCQRECKLLQPLWNAIWNEHSHEL